jgi:hypothetical protein
LLGEDCKWKCPHWNVSYCSPDNWVWNWLARKILRVLRFALNFIHWRPSDVGAVVSKRNIATKDQRIPRRDPWSISLPRYASDSWVGFGFYFINAKRTQWRMPLAIQCLPPLVLVIGVMLIPESPRWRKLSYLSRRAFKLSARKLTLNVRTVLDDDRADEAYKAFTACRTESVELTDEAAIQEEFHLLHLQLNHKKENQVTLLDFWRQPSLRKRCIIGFLTMFAAQGTATLIINST